jgi:flagellar basal-body rod modification protein FlgD
MASFGIDSVTGLQNTTYNPNTAPATQDLGSVDFMKLIIAQMRNQNPLEPQKDTDFMAQMAQFEALSQMKSMASGMKVLQGLNELSGAAAMIGKTVTGRTVDGIAIARDQVAREKYGQPFLKLNSEFKAQVNRDDRVIAAAADVQNAGSEITGKVDRVVVGPDGIPMLWVNGKVVDLFTVAEVR